MTFFCEWYHCPHEDKEISGLVAVITSEEGYDHYLHVDCLDGFQHQQRMAKLNRLYTDVRQNYRWN